MTEHMDREEMSVEIAKLQVKSDTIIEKLDRMEILLFGDDDTDGLRTDVAKLKAANAVIWSVVFLLMTGLVGTVGTIIGQLYAGN